VEGRYYRGWNDHCIAGKGVSRVKRSFGFLFVALFGGGVGVGLVVIVCTGDGCLVFFFFALGGRSFMGRCLASGIPVGALGIVPVFVLLGRGVAVAGKLVVGL